MLIMEIGQELTKVGAWSRTEVPTEELETTFQEMITAEQETFRLMGVDLAEVSFARSISARYQGQFHDVAIDVLSGEDRVALLERFHHRYEEIYGYSLPWRAVEILECHVRGSVAQAPAAGVTQTGTPRALEEARVGERRCCLRGTKVDVPVYRRELLQSGHSFAGPTLIDSRTSTIFVPEAFDASVDADCNVILRLRDAAEIQTRARVAAEASA
jgi:N-methylhydantoinase A